MGLWHIIAARVIVGTKLADQAATQGTSPCVSLGRILVGMSVRDMAARFGIVTALPEEFAAVRSFVDEPRRVNVDGDRGDYVIGTMPGAGCGWRTRSC